MSDVAQGQGWWQASDGKWYPPEQHPNYQPPVPATTMPVAYPAPTQTPPPGYWQGTDGNWYPPQAGMPVGHQAPKKKVYKRVWFWILIIVALGFGGCITIVSVASVAVNKAATTVHTATYSVTGNGVADINYDSLTNGNVGSSSANGSTLPWAKTVRGSGLITIFSVDAILTSGTTVTCTITVDGKVVESHSSTGQFASVSCVGGG
jgi:hypothetical protein